MKKSTCIKVTLYFLFSYFLTACCKEDRGCVAVPEELTASINLIDGNVSSQFYGRAVANFKFLQKYEFYKPADDRSSCSRQEESSTNLVIQNTTDKRITFDYNISFRLNFGSWNYQGTANIPAGSNFDVGTINKHPYSIALGSFVIQSLNISYQ